MTTYVVGTGVGDYANSASTTHSVSVVAPGPNSVISVWAQFNPTGGASIVGGVPTVDGNPMVAVGGAVTSSSERLQQFKYLGASAGSHTVLLTLSSAATSGLAAVAFTGSGDTDGGDIVDSNFAGTGPDAVLSKNIITTNPGDLVFAFANWVSSGSTIAAGTGYTAVPGVIAGNFGSACLEYKVQSAAGSITPTFTSASNADILCGTSAFVPGSGGGGGGGSSSSMGLLGVGA